MALVADVLLMPNWAYIPEIMLKKLLYSYSRLINYFSTFHFERKQRETLASEARLINELSASWVENKIILNANIRITLLETIILEAMWEELPPKVICKPDFVFVKSKDKQRLC